MSLSAPSPAPAAAPATELPDTSLGAPAHGWVDCPRCGEHWPAGSPYCSNCGWMPRTGAAAVPPRDDAAVPASRDGRLGTRLLAASLALVLAGLLWAWANDTAGRGPGLPQTPPPAVAMVAPAVPQPVEAVQQPAPSMQPASESAATALPAQPASTAATEAPAASARVESSAASLAKSGEAPAAAPERPAEQRAAQQAQQPASTDAQIEQWVRSWLAAEAGTGQDPDALRDFYADRVAYRGQAQAGWSSIAADKAAYMRRWPQRQYELLTFSTQAAQGSAGDRRVTVKLRWRLENNGRWRHGESTTSLTLRPVGDAWRIVAEGGV